MKKLVKDLIVGQVLETVRPVNLVIDALRRMEAKRIHSLLVFEGDEFCGIVTMTDIAVKAFTLGGAASVKSIMTRAEDVIYVSEGDDLYKCRELLKANNFHHLVVRNEIGKIVGVISSFDLMIAEDEAREDAADAAKDLPAS